MSANPVSWAATPAIQEAVVAAASVGVTLDVTGATWADWRAQFPRAEAWRTFNLRWDALMRTRCGIPEEQTKLGNQGASPKPPRVVSAEGKAKRWGAGPTPEQVVAVLPTDPDMAVSLGEINRRLKRAPTRDPRELKAALLALAADGRAAQTDQWARARNRAYESRQVRWYRCAA